MGYSSEALVEVLARASAGSLAREVHRLAIAEGRDPAEVADALARATDGPVRERLAALARGAREVAAH